MSSQRSQEVLSNVTSACGRLKIPTSTTDESRRSAAPTTYSGLGMAEPENQTSSLTANQKLFIGMLMLLSLFISAIVVYYCDVQLLYAGQ